MSIHSLKTPSDTGAHPFWSMELVEVFAVLTSTSSGLSESEAVRRRIVFGRNELPLRSGSPTLRILRGQLSSPLILLLIGAGATTAFLGEWVETIAIASAVAANTGLGFWQEYKAESALSKLGSYIRTRAQVRRDGRPREIDAAELVPGDVIVISRGDRVPADGRLIFANNLEVDEAVLTGESLPVAKRPATLATSVALPERRSMVYSGTLAVEGIGEVMVTGTGQHTEFGRIASLLARQERAPTPLERSIRRFVLISSGALGGLIAGLFMIGLGAGYGALDMFLIAVAVAVAAVPEGLPVALTVILAIGVERLARRNGVVRRLSAAETLGSTSIILTDKTGTLTQAKMELASILPREGVTSEQLLREALWNCDVLIENPSDPPAAWRLGGRPLEVALVRSAAVSGVTLPALSRLGTVVDRLPFSSERRFSGTTVRRGEETELILFGAPDTLVGYADLAAGERARVLVDIERHARSGEKVLGLAVRRAAHNETLRRFTPRDFSFRGLITFRDPLRPQAARAIRQIAAAGVATAIVTGDHKGTAEAIARELGMVDGKGAVLTGDDIATLPHETLLARAAETTVFARVTPEQKVELVRLFRERGEIVAVTGDGVNDAAALEAADVGIALGSGTDVTKSAADLVVLDDNYETVVAAIEEGRAILTNIKKVLVYLLSGVFDELFLIGGALIAGVPLPLSALQILFVNFFSDSFPAVALAFERDADRVSARPGNAGASLFDREIRFLILITGTLSSALLLVLYLWLLHAGYAPVLVRTFIFASFATYTLFLAFSVRSLGRPIWTFNPFSNRFLVFGVGIGLVLTAGVIYIPALQNIFETTTLPPVALFGILAVGLVNIAAIEFGKWLFYHSVSSSSRRAESVVR